MNFSYIISDFELIFHFGKWIFLASIPMMTYCIFSKEEKGEALGFLGYGIVKIFRKVF